MYSEKLNRVLRKHAFLFVDSTYIHIVTDKILCTINDMLHTFKVVLSSKS